MSESADLQSLTVLLAHADRQRDQALAAHRQARQVADAAAEQSTQLLAYRREYEARWNTQFRREGQIELVRCYHQFMDKLTQAVEHQSRVAAHAVRQSENTEAQLRAGELRCASVRKLLERRQRENARGAERRDQKQTDEQAMRSAWARRDTTSRY